jgi:hypothetical protein
MPQPQASSVTANQKYAANRCGHSIWYLSITVCGCIATAVVLANLLALGPRCTGAA